MIVRLRANGVDSLGNTPAEFAENIRTDLPLWRAAAEAAGIKKEQEAHPEGSLPEDARPMGFFGLSPRRRIQRYPHDHGREG